METENKFKYYAFISYKREDEEWAKWLQHKLEHYKLPSNLNGRTDLPKEIRPVFKDTSELNPGNLPQQIHDALEQSKFLIVICSPRSAQSEWVNKEVETFMGMGKTDKVIPFIIDGKAFAKDPVEECFPLAIRNLPSEQEILGANIGEMGRDAAAVKVVAQMFGLKFDELWQRHEREQRKKRNWIIAASVAGFLIMAGVALWMYTQRQQTLKANWKMMENQARSVAKDVLSMSKNGNTETAQRVALEILPKELSHPDRPYTIEGEAALRTSTSNPVSTLVGHSGIIYSVAFSPDGKYMASSSDDQTILIWEVESGRLVQSLADGKQWIVTSVDFSPDGKTLVSKDGNGLVVIWDLETGKDIRSFETSFMGEIVTDAFFSMDGKRIVSADHDGVSIWDAQTCSMVKKLAVNSSEWEKNDMTYAAFCDDGKRVVSLAFDGSVCIWDVEKGESIKTFDINEPDRVGHRDKNPYFHQNKIVSSNLLIATCNQYDVNVYNTDGEKIYYDSYYYEKKNVNALAISPDEKHLYVCYADFTIEKHDIFSNDRWAGTTHCVTLPALDSRNNHEGAMAVSPNGGIIAFANQDVFVWDPKKVQKYQRIGEHDYANDLEFSSDGTKIISVSSSEHSIKTWDCETHELIQTVSIPRERLRSFGHFILCNDDKHFIIKGSDDVIYYGDLETGEIRDVYKVENTTFAYDSFKNRIIIGESWALYRSAPYLITIINIGNSKVVGSWKHRQLNSPSPISHISYNPIKDVMATTNLDNDSIMIRNCKHGELLKTLVNPKFGSHSGYEVTQFSPLGDCLLAHSANGEYQLWNLESEQILYTIPVQKNPIQNLSFSPDGRFIVYSELTNIIVKDVKTGLNLVTIPLLGIKCIDALAFSPDGRTIVASCNNDRIVAVDFPPLQELIDQTRERFKDRPLTPEERRMYYLE